MEIVTGPACCVVRVGDGSLHRPGATMAATAFTATFCLLTDMREVAIGGQTPCGGMSHLAGGAVEPASTGGTAVTNGTVSIRAAAGMISRTGS